MNYVLDLSIQHWKYVVQRFKKYGKLSAEAI
jgi:hypothetical protein